MRDEQHEGVPPLVVWYGDGGVIVAGPAPHFFVLAGNPDQAVANSPAFALDAAPPPTGSSPEPPPDA